MDWHPKAILQPLGYDTYTGGGRAKIVWHTTEGGTYPGPQLYQGTNPHFTLDLRNAKLYQHVPLSKASKALRHPPGTGQTNNDNCVQVELVEFAGRSGSWPRRYYAQIASLARFIEANHGVARRGVNFRTQPRLGWQAWHIYTGHLGHRHVPSNDHVDPGPGFRIDLVLGGNDKLTELRVRLARLRADVRRIGRWTPGRKKLAKRLEGQIKEGS